MSAAAWGAIGLVGAAVATGLFGLGLAALTSKRTKGIGEQLKPNGGHSMYDLLQHVAVQVNVIEANQSAMASDIRGNSAKIAEHTESLNDHIDESQRWKAFLAGQGLAPPAA